MTPREVLLDIAAELEAHPDHWCQRIARAHEGEAGCILGHIWLRAGTNGPTATACNDAIEVVTGVTFPASWNDTKGRTVEDVIRVCREAAERLT